MERKQHARKQHAQHGTVELSTHGPMPNSYGKGQPPGPSMSNYGQGQPPGPSMSNCGQGQPPGREFRQSDPKFSCIEQLTIYFGIFLCVITFPFSLILCFKMVTEYERMVIFRVGKMLGKPRGPGIFCFIPCTDVLHEVDLRIKHFDIPPQEVLTRDSVTVRMDAVVIYSIFDPGMSVVSIVSADAATTFLAQIQLRNMVGCRLLTQVLSDREEMAAEMSVFLDKNTDRWGVKVDRVEIKDIRLPDDLKRAMAAEGEAVREAKAKVIAAEGEMNASRKLKEATDIMNENPQTLSLRYLQTMNTISAEQHSTIIFPLPIKMLPS